DAVVLDPGPPEPVERPPDEPPTLPAVAPAVPPSTKRTELPPLPAQAAPPKPKPKANIRTESHGRCRVIGIFPRASWHLTTTRPPVGSSRPPPRGGAMCEVDRTAPTLSRARRFSRKVTTLAFVHARTRAFSQAMPHVHRRGTLL